MSSNIGDIDNSIITGQNVNGKDIHIKNESYINSVDNGWRGTNLWVLILSIVSTITSIIAVAIANARFDNIDYDPNGLYGWIIAAFSIITTLLIGSNIQHYFQFEQQIKRELHSSVIRLEDKISEKMGTVRLESTGISLAQFGMTLYNNGDYGNSVQILFNAITLLDLNSDNVLVKESFDRSVLLLRELSNYISEIKDKDLIFPIENQSVFLLAAIKTHDDEILKLAKDYIKYRK